MNQPVTTIDKIRQALRALRNSVETHGQEGRAYNVFMGIGFAPTKGQSADQLIEVVNKNKTVSADLVYSMSAALKGETQVAKTSKEVIDAINNFEQKLASMPQELAASMHLEFTVSNEHEDKIVEETQKAINAIQQANVQDIQKLAKKA